MARRIGMVLLAALFLTVGFPAQAEEPVTVTQGSSLTYSVTESLCHIELSSQPRVDFVAFQLMPDWTYIPVHFGQTDFCGRASWAQLLSHYEGTTPAEIVVCVMTTPSPEVLVIEDPNDRWYLE